MKYIVYQTTNKENGKIYIGVHKTENPDVFDGYIGNGIYVGYSLENPKTTYQYALKKYGYHNFIRTTLYVFDNEEDAYDMESKIVTLEFIRKDNNYNIKVGGTGGGIYKQMFQFDLKGNFVKKWNSVTEIIEYYQCNPSRFRTAAVTKKSAFGSYWSFFDSINIEEYSIAKDDYLYQFDFKGNLIEIFKNEIDAINKLNLSKNSLREAVSQNKMYKECYWIKDPDKIWDVIKTNRLFNLRNKPIICYGLDKKYHSEYINMTTAAKELNIKYDTIKAAIKKGSCVSEKYYFSYDLLDEFKPYEGNPVLKKKVAQYDYNTNELIKIWDNISDCAKVHPKCRDVIKGGRNHTHGYTFKYID